MEVNKYDQDEENTSFSFSNFKRGLIYLKKYKIKLFLVFVLNCISIIAILCVTKILQYVIDVVIPNEKVEELFIIIVLALFLVLISVFLNNVYSRVLVKVNQSIVRDIKDDLFSHIQYLSVRYYDSRPHGKILVRLTEYVEDVSTLITDKLVTTFLNLFNMFIVLVFMFLTSVKLTFVVLVGIVMLVSIFVLTAKVKRKYKLLINNKNSNVIGYLLETLNGMQTTQAFNREEKNENIFCDLSKSWKDANCKRIKFANIGWFSVQTMSHFVLATIYFVGAMFLYPSISVGVIVAMGNYSSNFWQPIEELFKTLDEFIDSITYLERIFETIDEKIDIQDEKDAKDIEIKGEVEFRNVSFSYIKNNIILNNVSFKVKPQEKVAIVGATGSGKSTITNLIGRFYDINQGSIFIDGLDIKGIKLDCLRKQIAVMQQDNFLFSTSVMNNLKYGNENITDDEVMEVCKELNVHSWILGLESGYNTKLSGNGKNLSDGERQVLCYIRTIINNPRILIFDEATSKVDVKTEKMLQDLTREMIKNKTIITIAHRLSTIVGSDRIFFLKDKRIIECGTHQELMKMKGNYYNLYMSQQR